jgi:(2Fe-2S) ferredoxin
MSYYQRHVFFCTNLRGNEKKCCAQGDANAMREHAKKKLKRLGMHAKALMRTSTSGCLGRCEEGPVMVIYPDNIWYRYENLADIDEIIEKHVVNGVIVERLRLAD